MGLVVVEFRETSMIFIKSFTTNNKRLEKEKGDPVDKINNNKTE